MLDMPHKSLAKQKQLDAWVKTDIAATLYMYYGNGNATTAPRLYAADTEHTAVQRARTARRSYSARV